jgi:hypothetical protein
MPEFYRYEEDGMKRVALVVVLVVSLVAVAMAIAGEKSAGPEGRRRDLCRNWRSVQQTMSNNAGKCTCGKDMVKAADQGGNGKVQLTAAAGAEPFATTGICATAEKNASAIRSARLRQVHCGKEMKKVI